MAMFLLKYCYCYCSILIDIHKVCEKVALEGNILCNSEPLMTEVHNFEQAKAFIAKQNVVEQIEEKVKLWIKKLKDFIAESKQVKRENDNSGPQQELEYWKQRGAQFSQLVNRLQVLSSILFFQSTILFLFLINDLILI